MELISEAEDKFETTSTTTSKPETGRAVKLSYHHGITLDCYCLFTKDDLISILTDIGASCDALVHAVHNCMAADSLTK